jgi:hypothetical protein
LLLCWRRGVIIPPLPEKNAVQKFQMSTEFIEDRRRALQVNKSLSLHELQQKLGLPDGALQARQDVHAVVGCAACSYCCRQACNPLVKLHLQQLCWCSE